MSMIEDKWELSTAYSSGVQVFHKGTKDLVIPNFDDTYFSNLKTILIDVVSTDKTKTDEAIKSITETNKNNLTEYISAWTRVINSVQYQNGTYGQALDLLSEYSENYNIKFLKEMLLLFKYSNDHTNDIESLKYINSYSNRNYITNSKAYYRIEFAYSDSDKQTITDTKSICFKINVEHQSDLTTNTFSTDFNSSKVIPVIRNTKYSATSKNYMAKAVNLVHLQTFTPTAITPAVGERYCVVGGTNGSTFYRLGIDSTREIYKWTGSQYVLVSDKSDIDPFYKNVLDYPSNIPLCYQDYEVLGVNGKTERTAYLNLQNVYTYNEGINQDVVKYNNISNDLNKSESIIAAAMKLTQIYSIKNASYTYPIFEPTIFDLDSIEYYYKDPTYFPEENNITYLNGTPTNQISVQEAIIGTSTEEKLISANTLHTAIESSYPYLTEEVAISNTDFWQLYGQTPMRVYKQGAVTYFNGVVRPKRNKQLTATNTEVCVLPEDYRPNENVQTICQGTVSSIFLCTITSAGVVSIGRLRDVGSSNGSYSYTLPSSGTQYTWYPMNISWITERSVSVLPTSTTPSDYPSGGTTDYNLLSNKPQIEGVTLEGDKAYEDLNLQRITNSEMEELLTTDDLNI